MTDGTACCPQEPPFPSVGGLVTGQVLKSRRPLYRSHSSDLELGELPSERPRPLKRVNMHRAGVIAAPQAKGGGTRAVFPRFLHLHSFPPKAIYQPLIPLYKWWHLSLRKYVIISGFKVSSKVSWVVPNRMFEPLWSYTQLVTPPPKLGTLLPPGTALQVLPAIEPKAASFSFLP